MMNLTKATQSNLSFDYANFLHYANFFDYADKNDTGVTELDYADNNDTGVTELDYADKNDTGITDFPEPFNSIRVAVNWASLGIVLMSLAGNTLIILIMSRNRKTSTSVFFTALAVSDMLLVISVPFERWLHWTFNVSLYGISTYITTAKTVLTYSNIQISSWLLVCITVERVLSIAFPYKIKELCTKGRAGTAIVVVCVVIIGLNTCGFNFIVSATFNEAVGIIWVKRVDDGETIIAWMDFIASFFMPISIIILGSVYIVVHLLHISIEKHEIKNNRNRSVTMTLLAANIVFVVTMSPFVLYHLIYPNVHEVEFSPYLFWTLGEVFMFMSDMNAALNFYVYVLSGSRFRADVKKLCGLKQSDIASSPSVRRKWQLHALHAINAFKKYTVSNDKH